MYSVNQINGEKYKIPTIVDDSKSIDKFINKNKGKPVIVVQGLGFVGSVMSLVCANSIHSEYSVIGIDLPNESSYWKIKSINQGVFPIISSDKKVDKFFNNSIKKGNLFATCDPYAYSKADIIIVDVNLDVQKEHNQYNNLINFDVDLSHFSKAIEIIGENCKEEVLILIETTVPPGTCEKVVYKIIKDKCNSRNLDINKIYIGHSYERVMPGPNYIDSIQNFYRVYSGINSISEEKTEEFLKTIISTKKYPLTKLNGTNSTEIAKVLENSYRAMNIAFIVEWSRFSEKANINLYEVINAIRMRPTHKNIMLPGIGVGGYCLTKDPLMASWAFKNMFDSDIGLTQSEMGVIINDKMPVDAFEFLRENIKMEFKDKNVLLLGVSYLSNVGDTRYTPVETFYNCLKLEGANIFLNDPFLKYWPEKKVNIENNLDLSLKNNYDIIVFSTGHDLYRSNTLMINKIKKMDKLLIFDSIGVLNEDEIGILSKKHKVKILGRGDI
tara:strand:+ start:47099 stop:48592 length:1494 start_codon:yes stop_codon:yes gene_type:complete